MRKHQPFQKKEDQDEDIFEEIPEFRFDEKEVKLDEDLSNVIIVDNLPVIPIEKKDKFFIVLEKIFAGLGCKLLRKNSNVTLEEMITLPFDANNSSKGFVSNWRIFATSRATEEEKNKKIKIKIQKKKKSIIFRFAFIEFANTADAQRAVDVLNKKEFDSKHVITVNTLAEVDQFLKYPDAPQEFKPKPFEQRDNLRWWLMDKSLRDQYAIRYSNEVEVIWHDVIRQPELQQKQTVRNKE